MANKKRPEYQMEMRKETDLIHTVWDSDGTVVIDKGKILVKKRKK